MMGEGRSRGFSNKFSGAFLGTSASSLLFTNGETEVQCYIVARLTSTDGRTGPNLWAGATLKATSLLLVLKPILMLEARCAKTCSCKQVNVQSQQIAVYKPGDRASCCCSVGKLFFVWIYSFCFMCTSWVPLFGRAFMCGSCCFASAVSSEGIWWLMFPGEWGSAPLPPLPGGQWCGHDFWQPGQRGIKLNHWNANQEEVAAVDMLSGTHYFP